MSNFNLTGGNKWDAASVYDAARSKSQGELNATTAQLAALAVAANNGKVIGIVNGQLAAVELTAWTGGTY